jgi:hypothetical protein
MKKICLTISIAVFLLVLLNGLQAQTNQTNLNQTELIKQFIGSWKGEIAKDTTEFWDAKPYGTGLECNFKLVTKEKIIMEGKDFFGYDKKADKFIMAIIIKSMDIGLYATWFLSKSKYIIILHGDISNPEKASSKWEGEFKSPDMFIENTIVNNKIVKTVTYTRVK